MVGQDRPETLEGDHFMGYCIQLVEGARARTFGYG